MDLEGIKLSEISQAEKDTLWFHLYVEFKKQKRSSRRGAVVNESD